VAGPQRPLANVNLDHVGLVPVVRRRRLKDVSDLFLVLLIFLTQHLVAGGVHALLRSAAGVELIQAEFVGPATQALGRAGEQLGGERPRTDQSVVMAGPISKS